MAGQKGLKGILHAQTIRLLQVRKTGTNERGERAPIHSFMGAAVND